MTENKADPLREALEAARSEIVVAIAFLSRDVGTYRSVDTVRSIIDRLARADAAASVALAAPQPAAPLGGREAIVDELAQDMLGHAFCAEWHDDPDKGVREVGRIKAFFVQRLNGFADAILAAIPQELGDVERLLQDTLAEYEQTVEAAEKDTALSDTGRHNGSLSAASTRGAP